MSILFDDNNEERNIIQEEIHPMSYYATRQFEIQSLQDKVQFDNNLVTGINNSKLTFFLNEYQQQQQKISEKYKEEKRYLQPEVYDTIFDDKHIEGDAKLKQQISEEELQRQKYFEEFVKKPQIVKEQEEQELVCIFNAIEKERTDPQTSHLLQVQKGWLNELRKEVKYVKYENDKIIKKTQNAPVCRNMKLLKKLAPTVNNVMRVYFDEIFDALMSEILTEEVYFLNEMEQKGNFDQAEIEEHIFRSQIQQNQFKGQTQKQQQNIKKSQQQQSQTVKFADQLHKIPEKNDDLDDENYKYEDQTIVNNDSDIMQQFNYENQSELQFTKKELQRHQSPLKNAKRLASQQKIPIDLINAIQSLDNYGDMDQNLNEFGEDEQYY